MEKVELEIEICPYCGSDDTGSYLEWLGKEERECYSCRKLYMVIYKLIPEKIEKY